MVSSTCSSPGEPKVTIERIWVSPRLKKPEPWVRGRSPASAVSSRISPSLRPSTRLPDFTMASVIFSSVKASTIPWAAFLFSLLICFSSKCSSNFSSSSWTACFLSFLDFLGPVKRYLSMFLLRKSSVIFSHLS